MTKLVGQKTMMHIPMKVTLWNLYDFGLKHPVLAQHLAKSPRNACYTSKAIQNELVEVIGECICNDIIAKVKRAKLYSVIADEVTDTANKEELSLFTLCR